MSATTRAFSHACSLGILWILLAASPNLALGQDDENIVFDTTMYSGLEYRMIGPHRGGRVTAVTGIAERPYTYLMGSTGGGVWKTTDAGETWTNISDGGFAVASIGAIDVADSDPNVIYVGTGSACIRGNTSTGRGVYRSLDGGASWEFMGLREAGQIGRIVVHPRDPDRVYVAALGHPFGPNPERGVFRSRDGGATWEKVLFVSDSTGAVDLSIDPSNPRILYAGMWRAERKPWTLLSGAREGGIYRTTDSGDTWERVEGGLPQGLVGKTAVAISPADPDRIWTLIEAPEDEGGLYRSDDGGETWKRVNGERKLRQRAWYYTHLYADPRDENTVYVLNVRFHKSIDGGKSFETIDVKHGDVHDLWLNPEDPEYRVVGNDGGAQVTLNGGRSWSTMMNQPTAELYSVTVDNQFPYRVYGPQQDNSTISVPSWTDGGIAPQQYWYSVGGCETGPIAMHPDHPDVIYSGCYGGTIDRVDRNTDQVRNVLLYPQLQLGQAPRDLEYRFQWNSPILVSPHDPNVVYHASQYVHRTTDGGHTWETISPDLTTNTAEHQDYAGEPITKDNTGVEVYNTIFSLVVSPHSPDVLWAGTDDGRVHITRDGGATWSEITPAEMPQLGTVDAIEVSPHQPGRAFLAVHRYRLDDFAPYIFRTEDYGQSWRRLTNGRNGIPSDYPVRVIREDPDRRGLLYAGTEFGLFVSFDDGAHWQSLQRNLPVSPVTDLAVHRKDLVLATQGRSFWVLDDLTPLHQLNQRVAGSERYLFEPREAYRADVGGFRQDGRAPEYPPEGALIHYYLAEDVSEEVRLEILDAAGNVVRSFSSDTTEKGGDIGKPVPSKTGMHRYVWDLQYPGVDDVDDAIVWGFMGGPEAVPGDYRARLSVGDWTETRAFQVRKDPRLEGVSRQDLQEQFELMVRIRDAMNGIYDAIRTIRSVRDQVQSVARRAEKAGLAIGDLTGRAETIADRLTELENELMQTKNESRQDPLNFPPRLDNQFAALYGYVGDADAKPTRGAYTRLEDLMEIWRELEGRLDGIVEREVPTFNEALERAGVPGIIVEARERRAATR